MTNKIWIGLILVFAAGMLSANNYYISSAGNNSDPGTLEQSWRTAKYAIERLYAGDNLYFRGGKYPVETQKRVQQKIIIH